MVLTSWVFPEPDVPITRTWGLDIDGSRGSQCMGLPPLQPIRTLKPNTPDHHRVGIGEAIAFVPLIIFRIGQLFLPFARDLRIWVID